jgi:uncharacterized membrane protein YbjE (DUF340 family)
MAFDAKPLLILLAGTALGASGFLPEGFEALMGPLLKGALVLLFLAIGLDMGKEERLWESLRSLKPSTLLMPVAALIGSVGGGILVGVAVGLPVGLAAAASAGCGYYSITMILLKEAAGVEAATIGFFANLAREILIIVAMPLVVRLFGKSGAVGAAGATAMDTALPFIVRSAGKEVAVFSFLSGVVLTLLIPFAVPLLYRLLS